MTRANFHILNENDCHIYMITYTLNLIVLIFHSLNEDLDTKRDPVIVDTNSDILTLALRAAFIVQLIICLKEGANY